MIKVYDENMNPLYNEDKRVVHQKGLWHKVVSGILFNSERKTLYFQTIYPKDSYTFVRPDYIDFAVGGHIDDDETPLAAIAREAREELGLENIKPQFLGIRVCRADPAPDYIIREFQYFYGIETSAALAKMDFAKSDSEVKSVIEVKIDDFLALLSRMKKAITANEMLLDKITRRGEYNENISLSAERIIPDYFNDKSILEKILSLKNFL